MRRFAEVRKTVRVVKQFKFDHRKKRMTTVVELPDGRWRVLVKGASEIVLKACTRMHNDRGQAEELGELMIRNLKPQVITPFVPYRAFSLLLLLSSPS